MSLSSLLVQREVATIRDVEEALARQVLYGGDLVTNLLESAMVDEAKLCEVLGEVTGLRPAGSGTLPSAGDQARSMLPPGVAEQRALVPIALTEDGEQLVVAVAEPLSSADDEKLMFALGIPLVQRVAPLVRIREALARDFGVALDARFTALLRRMRGEPPEPTAPPKPRSVPVGFGGPHVQVSPAIVDKPRGGVPKTTINSFPAPQRVDAAMPIPSLETTPTPGRTLVREGSVGPRPPRRRRGPITFDGAKRELETTEDRDGLLDLFFDFSRQYFDYAALFVVHGDLAEGRDSYGSGAARDRVATIGVPLDLPSMLSVAKERAVPVVSVPDPGGIDQIFLSDLGRAPSSEVIIVPLVVRRRTVALLYGDSTDSGAPVENPSDVTTFALLVGQSFERMIMRKKGGSDHTIPRMPQIQIRQTPQEDRAAQMSALSRVITPEEPMRTMPAQAPPHVDPRSPVATSVPPPRDLDAAGRPEKREESDAPPPANVLIVRRPSGPPIPREEPADSTQRPPDQVFSPAPVPVIRQPSRPPPPPTPSRPPPPPSQSRPPPPTESAPPTPAPVADADATPIATILVTPVPADEAATPIAPAAVAAAAEASPSVPVASPRRRPNDWAEESPSGPQRVDASEMSAVEARALLAELDGEEISDELIEETSPSSTIPPSQTVVVAPRRPPTSRTDTENLPTIIVDVSAELEVLVRDIAAGKNEERAEQELLRQGAAAMPAILGSFPGPIKNQPTNEQENLPAFSSCGPVLRLVAAQRRVAVPYMIPLLSEPVEERRFWATFALTELAYPEGMSPLIPRLFDESLRVRRAARAAVAALSRVQGEHVARELGRYARDTQNERRRRLEVIRLLEDVREALAVPTFISLLDDADRPIADAALGALEVVTRQELGGDTKKWKSWWNAHSSRHRIEWLIDALMHESLAVRRAAAEELKATTREYFGYYADETRRDREKAQTRYREWWQNEGRLKFIVQ